MKQYYETKNPIPSCELHGLKYIDNEFIFIYQFNTPFKLEKGIDYSDKNLIIYGHISDLEIKEAINTKLNVNIPISSLEEYISYLEKQREEDLSYRESYIEKNGKPKYISVVKVENRDYDVYELKDMGLVLVSKVLRTENNKTVFAASYGTEMEEYI